MDQADEDEDQKLLQSKAKQKKKASQAITKSVVNSATGATAKQQKRKKPVADEAADRRTVFVGNLPVSCTVQVSGCVLSAEGMKGVAALLSLKGCFQLGHHTHL